ncbi:MAG TPA: Ig-like domain-containing protein, partial [Candidatus Saccharibacteria bacterium]|nr:Ig-like domain-containing protein [Candidatus Saccharibacteria bacterium]
YDVTITGLAGEGTIALNTYTASLLDIQGNPATDTSFTSPAYTRDITDPVVTVNVLTTNQPQPALSGTVSDTGADVVVTVNGVNYTATVAGTTWTLPAGTISPALVDGIYDIEVMAADLAGNVGVDTTTNELVVDTVRPTVTINQAAGQDDPTNVDSIVFDVVFSEAFTAGDFTAVDVVLSGTTATVASVLSISPTQWRVTVSGATSGDIVTASIAVDAVSDAAGNTSLVSTSTDASVLYDNVAPVVTIDTLSTTNASPALTGTVDDPAATVQVTVAGVTYVAINDGTGYWSLATGAITPALGAGTYDVVVRATDAAGNVGSDTSIDELTITAIVTPPVDPEVPVDSDMSNDGGIQAPNSGAGVYSGVHILLMAILIASALMFAMIVNSTKHARR